MTTPADKPSKLCLDCARRKLAKLPTEPCSKCLLINVDPLAQVRANAAKESPLKRFMTDAHSGLSFNAPSIMPAKSCRRGMRP